VPIINHQTAGPVCIMVLRYRATLPSCYIMHSTLTTISA